MKFTSPPNPLSIGWRGGAKTLLYWLLSAVLLLAVVHVAAQDEGAVLHPGVHQAEDGAIQRRGFSWVIEFAGAEGGQTLEAEDVTFTAYGTDVFIRIGRGVILTIPATGGNGRVVLTSALEVDAYDELCESFSGNCAPAVVAPPADAEGWVTVRIAHSNLPESHTVQLNNLFGYMQIDSITVADRTFQNVAPLAAGVLIFAGMLAWVVVSSLWARWGR